LKNIKNLLEKPGADTRPWAIWIWNSCITREKLVNQLNSFIEKGFGGVAIKPSRDMVPSYLSNDFFDLFKTALKLAQQGNIGIRISEDFGLPWNNLFEAITSLNKRLRAQRLRLEYAELISGKKIFEKKICHPEDSTIMISKVVNGKIILSQTKKYFVTPEKNNFLWKAPAGDWQLMIFIKEYVSDQVCGFVPNVYNPDTAQYYINSVGEPFKKKFSKFIPSTFKGFIHEMPAYVLPGDNAIPWDDDVASKYQAKYRKKLIDMLPALFFNVDDAHAKYRPQIYSFLIQAMYDRFATTLEKWCKKNHVSQWVLCPERSISRISSGFKFPICVPEHGSFGAIGIQNQEGSEENFPLLRTVADMNSLHYHRENVLVIGRNRQGSGATLQQLKSEVDLGLLSGPSKICLDGCFFNIDRRSYIKTPHNPSWYSPDWVFMKSLCQYIARATEITKQHHFLRQVAVLMPSISALADHTAGSNDSTQKAMTLIYGTLRELERINLGYDIVNEEMLHSCAIFSNGEFSVGGKIRKGNYKAVIVPYARLIPSSVLAFLEKLKNKKGLVIFIDEAPQGSTEDGITATFASRIKKLLQSKTGKASVALLRDLEAACAEIRPVVSLSMLGKKCTDIFSSHNATDGMDMFCMHNISPSQDYTVTVEIPEQKNMFLVDCTRAEVHELQEVQKQDKKCRINLTFLPKQTYFIVSSSQKLETTALGKGKKHLINTLGSLPRSYRIVLKDQWQFCPASLNMLPLANWNTRIGLSREFGSYSLFYEAYFEVRDIPNVCMLVLGALTGNTTYQRCASQEKPLEVTINGTHVSDTCLTGIAPAPVDAGQADAAIPLHDATVMQSLFGTNTFSYNIKEHIRKGINRISLRTLGMVFDPLTIVYPPLIAGSFSIVKGSAGWILSTTSPAVGHDSWTRYGYPYLSGTGIYKQVFELPGEYKRLVLRFSQVSDTIDVSVNGKPGSVLNWHPMELDITDACDSKRNELTVRIVNTLDNVLRMNNRPSGLIGEAYVDVY
jgi:Glycosyl hydrolases family 2, sugar binding domain.